MYWGTSMPRITDGTPRVGAVAWWKANTGPAGSVGHVAYVERVVSADEVVVSQDSWGGDFSWAVITRSSGNWPSGFIHFNDVPLTNTAAPAVSGVAKVGSTLTATPGAWKPGAVDVAYQWFAGGQPISGATAAQYRLTRAVLGQQVSVTTTASKLGYPTRSVSSAATEAVLPGMLTNTAAPTVTGDPTVDQVLSVQTGTWNPAPTELRVQWTADGQPIAGATGSQLPVTPDLVGRQIGATVTATRAGYTDVSSTSSPTVAVRRATFGLTEQPAVSGTPRLGEVLSATLGASEPSATTVAVQWLRDGEPVPGADAATYQLTNLDLGHRLSVVVTRSRDGYEDATASSASSTLVKTDPTMAVHVQRSATGAPGHWVRVSVAVTAPGLAVADGPVVMRIAGVAKAATLRDGRATVTLWKLPPGERTLTVRYAGSDTVARLVLTRTVTVR
jgi:hypothetical protein